MKTNSSKITLCAMLAALSVLFMLMGYFPYFTYTAPAVAGVLLMVAVIEIDLKWALGTYIASSVIIFLIGETESKLMYVFLFGFYPIVKAAVERIRKPVLEWIVKLAVFNAAVLAVYGALSFVFDLSVDDFGAFGEYGALIFLAFGNFVFVIYDIAVSRLSQFYFARLHDKIQKILKINR